jgi:predicted Zn-dependent protease
MYRLIFILLPIVFFGCSYAPETGRSQFIMMSTSKEKELGEKAFAKIMKKEEAVTSGVDYEMVQRVGEKIALAAQRLYPDAVQGYKWNFVLIKDKDKVNAWALPGGKCGVYTGILPVTKNEDALAAVLAHEVAHVIARHGAEQYDQSRAVRLVGVALTVAGIVSGETNSRERAIVIGAYSFGLALPFSRTQESEADQLSLYIAADAGFDPREAIPLWRRMGKEKKGAPPEFMSTHPSSKTRIQQLRGWMPKAMMLYDTAIAHESALQKINTLK